MTLYTQGFPRRASQCWFIFCMESVSLRGVSFFIAMIVNFIKKDDLTDPLAKSHFQWQIRSAFIFLFGLFLSAVLLISASAFSKFSPVVIFLCAIFGFANTLWFVYRLIKGALNLNDGKPMSKI